MAVWDIPMDEEYHGEEVFLAINDALTLLRSNWYGSTDPATGSEATPGMLWHDNALAGSTGSLVKHRTDDNSKWITTISLPPDSDANAGIGYRLSQDGNDRITGGADPGTVRILIGGVTAAASRLTLTTTTTDLRSNTLKDPGNDGVTTGTPSRTGRVVLDIGGVTRYLHIYDG